VNTHTLRSCNVPKHYALNLQVYIFEHYFTAFMVIGSTNVRNKNDLLEINGVKPIM